MKKVLSFIFCLNIYVCCMAQNYSMWGNCDKKTFCYKPGDMMIFTIKLFKNGKVVEGKELHWKRTGDDGITKHGRLISKAEGVKITISSDKPGFVRLYVTAYGKAGKRLEGKDNFGKVKPIFFDGGACVTPEKLQGLPEPVDFDEFWKKQKELLKKVPLKVLEMKEVEGNDQVKVFDMKIACPGKMPVSGYLVMPKNAEAKSLPAQVSFQGYKVKSAIKRLKGGTSRICFDVNAHGIENGKPEEYYKKLRETTLNGYGFNKKENSDPDTTYFHDMFLRGLRALEFVKSLPEWNGKDLRVTGGSQGGFQSLAMAGLDKDVTYCYAWSPWSCDIGGRAKFNRLIGRWHLKHSRALEYYDPVNMVKRASPNCRLEIVANLGDYVAPPSGVWIVFNNFPGPKTMDVKQGCGHGYTMKNYSRYIIKKNQ